MNFNIQAQQTIQNLSKLLGVKEPHISNIISPYSVGVEVEIKFKYFFPEISDKYFKGKKYWKFSTTEKEEVTKVIDEAEKNLKVILEKTVEAGIPKGTDRYWEFAPTPVYDLSLIIKQLSMLRTAGLIPKGEHSFHLNIGGLKAIPDVYYILMVLELCFLKKERIIEGFPTNMKPYATWSKKGYGGIMIKNEHDLVGVNEGVELRSLCLSDDTNLIKMFNLLQYFLLSIKNKEKNPILEKVKEKMLLYGLPDKNWQKPQEEPKIWNRYIEVFDEFSSIVKKIVRM